MEIKEKKVKEVEETVGYKCDICNKDMNIEPFYSNLKLNTVKYNVPCGGYGERDELVIDHVCSVECLKKSLKGAYFGADVFLSRKLIEELTK